MSIESVRKYFKQYGRENDIMELTSSSATVELAALALNVEPARIAKTLALKQGDKVILVVTAGDAKIDNAKFKRNLTQNLKCLMLMKRLNGQDIWWEEFAPLDLKMIYPFILIYP